MGSRQDVWVLVLDHQSGSKNNRQLAREGLQALGMLHVLRGASAMNYFHDKFGVLHRLLCCLKVLLRTSRCTDENGNQNAPNLSPKSEFL